MIIVDMDLSHTIIDKEREYKVVTKNFGMLLARLCGQEKWKCLILTDAFEVGINPIKKALDNLDINMIFHDNLVGGGCCFINKEVLYNLYSKDVRYFYEGEIMTAREIEESDISKKDIPIVKDYSLALSHAFERLKIG